METVDKTQGKYLKAGDFVIIFRSHLEGNMFGKIVEYNKKSNLYEVYVNRFGCTSHFDEREISKADNEGRIIDKRTAREKLLRLSPAQTDDRDN